MSLLAEDTDTLASSVPTSWPQDLAKKELFARIARSRDQQQKHLKHVPAPFPIRRLSTLLPTGESLLRYAAVILLAGAAIGISSYRIGLQRGHALRQTASAPNVQSVYTAGVNLESSESQSVILNRELQVRSAKIEELKTSLDYQRSEVARLNALQDRAQQDIERQRNLIEQLGTRESLANADRDVLGRKLQEAQASLINMQKQVETLQEERRQKLLQVTSLETRVEELAARLKQSNDNLHEQEQFLASDRDIRELVGARELYIADVFDIDREGKTQKPFGRIFYTAGKSLIFYAFDLDQQPGLRDASTFQAWGRRGPQDRRPLNMGIFYLDNKTNRRWVLRFDDPQILAQIDAVFVTVEPHGGRSKPDGKQLLFASLRRAPNHP